MTDRDPKREQVSIDVGALQELCTLAATIVQGAYQRSAEFPEDVHAELRQARAQAQAAMEEVYNVRVELGELQRLNASSSLPKFYTDQEDYSGVAAYWRMLAVNADEGVQSLRKSCSTSGMQPVAGAVASQRSPAESSCGRSPPGGGTATAARLQHRIASPPPPASTDQAKKRSPRTTPVGSTSCSMESLRSVRRTPRASGDQALQSLLKEAQYKAAKAAHEEALQWRRLAERRGEEIRKLRAQEADSFRTATCSSQASTASLNKSDGGEISARSLRAAELQQLTPSEGPSCTVVRKSLRFEDMPTPSRQRRLGRPSSADVLAPCKESEVLDDVALPARTQLYYIGSPQNGDYSARDRKRSLELKPLERRTLGEGLSTTRYVPPAQVAEFVRPAWVSHSGSRTDRSSRPSLEGGVTDSRRVRVSSSGPRTR